MDPWPTRTVPLDKPVCAFNEPEQGDASFGPGSGARLRCGSKLYHKHGGPECGAEGGYQNRLIDSVCGSRLSLDSPTNGEAIIDRAVYTRKKRSKLLLPCA